MRLYVGNLPFTATEDEIRALFESFGAVREVKSIVDRDTNRPRGFAFVTMATLEAGADAIKSLHQTEFGGRTIVVSQAKERSNGRNGTAQRAPRAYAWD